MRKLGVLLSAIMLVLTIFTPSVHASQPPAKLAPLYIDGQPTSYISKIIDGQKVSLIALRAASSALKLDVTWAPADKTWVVANDNHRIVLKLNSKVAQADGKSTTLPVPAQNINGVGYVPLRFIVEASGGRIIEVNTKQLTVGESVTKRTTLILWASSSHHEELIRYIWDDDVEGLKSIMDDWHELTLPDDAIGIGPYAFANSTQMIQAFLDAGFPINYRQSSYNGLMDDSGYTLLHSLAYNGQYELVSYLLEHGVDANMPTISGDLAIDLAIQGKEYLEKGDHPFEISDVNVRLANYDKTIELLRKYTKFDLYFKDNKGNILAEDEDIVPDSVTVQQALGDPSGNSYQISMTFKDPAKLESITAAHVGETIGIYLNEKLLVDPMVSAPIKGGSLAISGQFTEEEANAFIEDLKQAMA